MSVRKRKHHKIYAVVTFDQPQYLGVHKECELSRNCLANFVLRVCGGCSIWSNKFFESKGSAVNRNHRVKELHDKEEWFFFVVSSFHETLWFFSYCAAFTFKEWVTNQPRTSFYWSNRPCIYHKSSWKRFCIIEKVSNVCCCHYWTQVGSSVNLFMHMRASKYGTCCKLTSTYWNSLQVLICMVM